MTINPKHAFSQGTSIVPFLVEVRGSEARRKMDELTDDTERQSLLDGLSTNLDMKVTGWLDYYEALRLVEENDWYWKAKGHATFTDWLTSTVGSSFEQWRDLESLYNYAKSACPSLFGINELEAAQLAQQVAQITPMRPHGRPDGRPEGRPGHLKTEMDAAKATPHQQGQHSLTRVVATLKRDKPEVIAEAERQLAEGTTGDLIKINQKTGKKQWNVKALQEAGGLETQLQQKARLAAAKAAKCPTDPLVKFLDKLDSAHQADAIAVLKQYPWIVSGVRDG